MFHVLIESGAHPGQRRAGWTVTSAAVHAGLIAVAVALTLRDPASPPLVDLVRPDNVRWARPQPDDPRPGTSQPGPIPAPRTPILTIPTIHVDRPVIEQESLMPTDVFGANPASGGGGRDPGASGPTGIYSSTAVDRMVVPRSDNGSPIYPSNLRSAGVEGDVVVRFVVDSTGRVEAGSIAILEATHSEFGGAVTRWLLRARYEPAEANGLRVRQLVEQRFGFTLRR